MLLLAVFLLSAPVHAADGKVTIIPDTGGARTKSVVIDNGQTRVIIRTDEDGAKRLKKLLKKSGNVVIRSGNIYYPGDYYPYYRNKGTSYSVGRAIGTVIAR